MATAFKRPNTAGQGTGKPGGFQYRARTVEEVARRAHQGAGSKDGFIKKEFNTWTPADGENRVRLLPPTWDDAESIGVDVYVHYSVGADNRAYTCLKRQYGQPCPICEARAELDREGDDEAAKTLVARKRVLMWIIDRAQESKGALLWAAPWTLEQDISKGVIEESGAVLAIDHPREGYDVIFTRDQPSKNVPAKYNGVRISRRMSPIFEDAAEMKKTLDFITEHPVPTCLEDRGYDEMAAAFAGKPPVSTLVGQDKPQEERKSFKPPLTAKKVAAPAPPPPPQEEEYGLPTWEQLMEMEMVDLEAFANEVGIDFGDTEYEDENAVRVFIAGQLEIEVPAEEAPAPPPPPPVRTKPVLAKKGSAPAPAPAPAAATGRPAWADKLKSLKKKSTTDDDIPF